MALDAKLETFVQFDSFELDIRNHQLRRSGLPVDLPPQALKILALLAVRSGELVTRKEVKKELWPEEAHGDFDNRLNFAVRKLREALGDDAEHPRYVQTVRNAGYRFIPPVRAAPPLVSARSPLLAKDARNGGPGLRVEGELSSQPGLHFGRGILVLALIAVAASAVSIAALVLRPRGLSPRAVPEVKVPMASAESGPEITSVGQIFPQATQKIVIRGQSFGLHVPYAHTDSPYLAIRDKTAHWAAGRVIPWNWDEVMVDVEGWTDTEIVVSGFSGDYGVKGWKLSAGDELELAVWNPQSGVGPALYHTRVVEAAP